MKLFSAIMTIYILGLIILPCPDVHAENDSTKTNIKLNDTSQNNVDACSPFCLCDCCQTISYPANYHHFSHFTTLIGTSIPYIGSSELSVLILRWRPPKI